MKGMDIGFVLGTQFGIGLACLVMHIVQHMH